MLSFFSFLFELVVDTLRRIGYSGLLMLMTLESACFPIPSEVVMPFSGFLSFKGDFNLWYVVIIGTIGCDLGSIISYYVGLKFGRSFLQRYGKYLLIRMEHVDLAERWFKSYGVKAIFISRVLPAVRTVISLPAGIARMNFWLFISYSTLGSFIWCFILTYLGYLLGESWRVILRYSHMLSIAVLVFLSLAFLVYLIKNRFNLLTKSG